MARITTKTGLSNLTLSLLKTDGISSIDPPDRDSKPARLCGLWYDESRREVLQEYPWPFAIQHVNLSAATPAPSVGRWGVKSQLPSDFVRVSWVGSEESPLTGEYYKISGGFIMHNEALPLALGYVFDQEDLTKWSPKPLQTLARCMAKNIAYDLTGNKTTAAEAKVEYEDMLSTAMTLEAQASPPRRVQRSRWAASRRLGHVNRSSDY